MAKSYRQFCGLARGLDVVGERWTLLVIRTLLLGPKRHGDLLAQLPGIPTNLFANRLRELQESGLIERTVLPAPANVAVYSLGEAGRALEPAIMELARWGGRYMDRPRRDDALDIGWALLSTKRRYEGGESLVAELRVDARVFTLGLEPSYLRVEERTADAPQVRLVGTSDAFRRFLFEGEPSRERLDAAGIVVTLGTGDEVARMLGAFGPPERPSVTATRASSKPATPRRTTKATKARVRRT